MAPDGLLGVSKRAAKCQVKLPRLEHGLEPISSFWKCAILLVFVAQSMPHRCKSYMDFLFWVSMEL